MAEDEVTCAVCFESPLAEDDDDAPSRDGAAGVRARMPCCDRGEGATTAVCARCVEVICSQGPGGVGRCPRCRAYVTVARAPDPDRPQPRVVVTLADARGTCVTCRQQRELILHLDPRGRGQCDACALGARHPLLYECARCGGVQRIPHPMWRYQPTPDAFGDVTWACHVACGDYTTWRVHPDEAGNVPLADAPERWGMRDEWLAGVRAIRRNETRREGRRDEGGADGGADGDDSDSFPGSGAWRRALEWTAGMLRRARGRRDPPG